MEMSQEFKDKQNAKYIELLKRFEEWIEDGNVITKKISGVKYYATQDALYKNKIKSKEDLLDYFVNQFNY
jgi:hypothetical protein|tara:strand:- start:1899 stop:2108 length:210 start_codon:yes stop_codon:yes gene_type:complete